MSDLEGRYREALRWYPKRWRAANENAMVGTLLDLADGDHRSEPAIGELANLRRSGMSARFGIVGRLIAPTAREHAAVLALGLGTSISAAGILFGSWTYQFANHVYQQVLSVDALLHNLGAGQATYLFWLVAFVAVMTGFRRLAAVVLVVSIPVSIAWSVTAFELSDYGHPSDVSLGFLSLLAVVSAFGLSLPGRRSRKPFLSAFMGFGLLLAGAFWLRGYGGGYWGNGARNIDYFWAPLAVWLVFLGIPIALTVGIILWRLQRRNEAIGVLFAAAPLLPLALLAFGGVNDFPTAVGVLAAIIVVVTIIVGILRVFGLRINITRV
jgi:hypothetical protein